MDSLFLVELLLVIQTDLGVKISEDTASPRDTIERGGRADRGAGGCRDGRHDQDSHRGHRGRHGQRGRHRCVDESWRAICAGVSTARRDPKLAGLPVDISCTVPGFSAAKHVGRRSTLIHDRFVQLTIAAAREGGRRRRPRPEHVGRGAGRRGDRLWPRRRGDLGTAAQGDARRGTGDGGPRC